MPEYPSQILRWLHETSPEALDALYSAADRTRRQYVGNQVHLRGVLEISNACARQCGYCGLRAGNHQLMRYRMTPDEILESAHEAAALGYGTLVLQAGESRSLTGPFIGQIVRIIKRTTPLAVTLSLGERSTADLKLWRKAGADRYLLRFETSDPALYGRIHPRRPGAKSDRIVELQLLRRLGYEVGSGMMIGIPGQSYASLEQDLLLAQKFDIDMVSIGLYQPHPAAPLGRGEWVQPLPAGEQVPATDEMVCKAMALARLLCPQANVPSTTAAFAVSTRNGGELGLTCGANVVMPNLTPARYRTLREGHPNAARIAEPSRSHASLHASLAAIGRVPGSGPGGRARQGGYA
jgi:biotin synthase